MVRKKVSYAFSCEFDSHPRTHLSEATMKKQPKTAKHIPTKGVDFGEHLKAPGGCDPCRDVSTKQPQGPSRTEVK